MKVRVEYTIYKTMDIEIPKALSEAYRKEKDLNGSFDGDCAYNDISEFAYIYVKAEEGKDIVGSIFDWNEVES